MLCEPLPCARSRIQDDAHRGPTAGSRAHTARAWMGRNAIHRMGEMLSILASYVPRQPENQGSRYHEGLQAVYVDGGAAGNVVPDRATITINHRFAPDRSAAEAEAHVRELLRPVLEPGDDFEVVDVGVAAAPHLSHRGAALLWTKRPRSAANWAGPTLRSFAEREVFRELRRAMRRSSQHTREHGSNVGSTFAYAALADLLTHMCDRSPTSSRPTRRNAPRTNLLRIDDRTAGAAARFPSKTSGNDVTGRFLARAQLLALLSLHVPVLRG